MSELLVDGATVVEESEGWILTAANLSVPIGKIVGPVNGSRCTLGIRPEHVRLNTGGNVDTTCRVAFTEQLGGETYLYYDVEVYHKSPFTNPDSYLSTKGNHLN